MFSLIVYLVVFLVCNCTFFWLLNLYFWGISSTSILQSPRVHISYFQTQALYAPFSLSLRFLPSIFCPNLCKSKTERPLSLKSALRMLPDSSPCKVSAVSRVPWYCGQGSLYLYQSHNLWANWLHTIQIHMLIRHDRGQMTTELWASVDQIPQNRCIFQQLTTFYISRHKPCLRHFPFLWSFYPAFFVRSSVGPE